VSGLATLKNELFTVREDCQTVFTYNLLNFVESRQIIVPDMKSPLSLAACHHHNCLYVSDKDVECIHRADLSNSSMTKWSLQDISEGLSMTRNRNLLVTLCRTAKLKEFTTHGSLVREISLDVSVDRPRCSFELDSGLFVVCHQGNKEHRVCIVDKSGCIIKSYGGAQGSTPGFLCGPFCLAVDKRGNVFVSDYVNNKVQVLNSELLHIDFISLPKLKMCRPHRLHLDERSGRLYIAEGSKIFKQGLKDGTMYLENLSNLYFVGEKKNDGRVFVISAGV
jgi:sugar lactone lactonase YvrE